jgi:hypothetical protein
MEHSCTAFNWYSICSCLHSSPMGIVFIRMFPYYPLKSPHLIPIPKCSRGHPEYSGQAVSHLQTDHVEGDCYKSSHTEHTKILNRKMERMCVNVVMKYCINILLLLLWQHQEVNIIKLCKKCHLQFEYYQKLTATRTSILSGMLTGVAHEEMWQRIPLTVKRLLSFLDDNLCYDWSTMAS